MKDLLSKLRAMLATTTLREMADLANHVRSESSEITALKQTPKSADPLTIRRNKKHALVIDGPGEIRKDRYEMPHAQTYEDDRKSMFITYLYDNRYEQSERITSYFRLRSMYLKSTGTPDDSNPQQNLATATVNYYPRLSAYSAYSPREDLIQGAEHMKVDGDLTEDTMM